MTGGGRGLTEGLFICKWRDSNVLKRLMGMIPLGGKLNLEKRKGSLLHSGRRDETNAEMQKK